MKSLPKFNSIRSKTVKSTIDKSKVTIFPFTNKHVLNLEEQMEQINNTYKDVPSDLRIAKSNFIRNTFAPLVCDSDNILSYIDSELVFVESYKLSKGDKIEMVYTCANEKCGHQSTHFFDINKGVKFTTFSDKPIVVDEFKFNLKYPDVELELLEGDDDKNKLAIKRYLLGFLESMEIQTSEDSPVKIYSFKDYSIDDLIKWVDEELSVSTWLKIQGELSKRIPSSSYKYHFSCKKCGFKEDQETEFNSLPDFSLGLV